ncbi:hypothetical protein ACFRAE_11240 [Sphingobacterium sp. HJSM2_6]|uniref:hypothetical protein n=1 Tax=Sphingobacterium sp. HJSM2_6 TaxID=3366264 RepID=UPI003BDF8423
MRQRFYLSLLVVLVVAVFSSCERDDDEPLQSRSISRLYVSYSNFQPDESQTQIDNISVISNADSSNFGILNSFYRSAAKGGSTIYFHPSSQTVFHASINSTVTDTLIQTLRVGETGQVSSSNTKIPNGRLTGVRGLVFHPGMDKLYAVSVNSKGSFINIFDRPRGISSYTKTSQRYILANNLPAWDAAIVQSNLVLSRTGTNGGLDIFEDIIPKRDSVFNNVSSTRSLTVEGANNIRGMSIDTVNNMLALTDYSIINNDTVGRILIFDNFSEISKVSGNITPSRIISGANTLLKQPVDVDLDFRLNSKYLYVVDPATRYIHRFLKTDNGNIKPESSLPSANNRRPISISLDARQ